MAQSNAKVATTHGSRYLQQLCKHWAHKFAVDFTPEAGSIVFGEGQLITMTAGTDVLDVTVSAENPEDLPRMETVVANHIIRFAFREELVFDWSSDAV